MVKCVRFETVFVANCASWFLDGCDVVNTISDGVDGSAIGCCVLVQDCNLAVLLDWADCHKVGYSVLN